MKNKKLIQWLKDNSSGVYRPSAEAADLLESSLYVIQQVLDCLPSNKDWLDPEVERLARKILER